MGSIGAYQISAKLGEGGMATVYKGVQVSLRRPVAIKVLSRKLAGDGELLERFQRESLIIARLTHPNIIHVIDRGVTRDGRPYFVMEYVEGTDLARVIRSGALDYNRKLDVVIQVCKALAYAHRNGVVHRDIKPANILIDADGNARVLDFGIAQFAVEGEGEAGPHTQSGVVMGTYAYMSPEQQQGAGRVTAASDLFSLGAVMYELFTGVRPAGRIRPPSELLGSLPEALDELILRCLEPDPLRRFRSAGEVRDALLKVARGAHLEREQRARAEQGLARVEDKFALLDVIKEDRHGAVYLYEDRVEHKLLIIKKKPAQGAGHTEARLLTTLKHPHVANVLGTSHNQRVYIVVMEYLSGGSLRDRLAQPLPGPEALRIACQICDGLAFAHRNRVVHGNLRPSNVLFTEAGQVKLSDFGMDEHYAGEEEAGNWYAVRGEPRTPLGDVFAVGVLLYQMLTGALPVWHGRGLESQERFRSLPEGLQAVLGRALQVVPERRPPSAEALKGELEGVALQADAAPTVVAADPTPAPTQPAAGALQAARARRRQVRLFWLLIAVAAGGIGYLQWRGELGRHVEGLRELWEWGRATVTRWLAH